MDAISYTTIMAVSMIMTSGINNYVAPIENGYISTIQRQEIEYTAKYTTPVEYNAYRQRIEELRCLPDNWDGYNASKIDIETYINSLAFIDCIDTNILNLLSETDITPTPYGTITMNFRKDENVVSVEIGKKNIGFFTDFENLEDLEIESENFVANHLPKGLEKALNILEDA